MFIDYVTLMLINMTGGLVVLAFFVLKGMELDQRTWAPAFAVTGAVAVICGFVMIFTWPLPGSFNMAFGELSILLGALFLGAALATAKGWRLNALTYYAFVAGVAAVVVGARIIMLGLTMHPLRSGIGFILTGAGGVGAYAVYRWRSKRTLRGIGAAVILAAALIWAITGYTAYWGHMKSLQGWTPRTTTATE